MPEQIQTALGSIRSGSKMEFPTDLDELVDLITSGQLDNDSIIRLLNIHKHMTGDCEQCLMISCDRRDYAHVAI